MEQIRLGIVGTGNVAWHLVQYLCQSEQVQMVVFSRQPEKNKDFFNSVLPLSTVLDWKLDVIVLAVSDNAIPKMNEYLANSEALVVHTSGFTDMDMLKTHRRGVFYLFQSMTSGVPQNLTAVPLLIEANTSADVALLQRLGGLFFENCFEMTSAQRKFLHIAAVFANNFTNHLLHQAEQICQQHDIPFAPLMRPLIEETIRKQLHLGAAAAQTGPASRGDSATIKGHLELLSGEQRELYAVLTKSIQKDQ